MKMKPTSARLRFFGLLKCQNGATVAEYAIAAAIAVAAWGSVDKPPFQFATSASASEACTHAPRGMTPRWQRPSASRCLAKTAA